MDGDREWFMKRIADINNAAWCIMNYPIAGDLVEAEIKASRELAIQTFNKFDVYYRTIEKRR